MKKIIIDTDPGIDDAFALCYAFAHPQLDVIALTTIFGNVDVELATTNALKLCELNNVSAPVAMGAAKPLTIAPNPHSTFVHGENGFGNVPLPDVSTDRSDHNATDTLINHVLDNAGEVTIVAVGPLTNLALALEKAPEIAAAVESVVIMGGAFDRPGNITAYAEANVWNAPHAAQKVLTADWPVVIHGLDVTHQVIFNHEFFDKLAAGSPKVGKFLHDAAEFYIDFYQQRNNFGGCCPHDQLALSYLTAPHLFESETATVDVVTDGDEIGRTYRSTGFGIANKQIVKSVDTSQLIDDYFNTITGNPPPL
jgi:inosine-uridine nucleoside N-ribohydrolase